MSMRSPLLTSFLAGMAFAAPSFGNGDLQLGSFASFDGNVAIATAAIGGPSLPASSLQLVGIPAGATIRAAYLYAATHEHQNPAILSGTFLGQAVTLTWIGTSPGVAKGSRSYRADVTSLVSGNGNYAYMFTIPNGAVYGAGLLVVYEDATLCATYHIELWDGNHSGLFADGADGVWPSTNITGLQIAGGATPEVSLALLVAGGQPGYSDSYGFQGVTISGSNAATQWTEWDHFDVSSLVSAGQTAATLTGFEGTDAIHFVAAVVRSRSNDPGPTNYCTAKVNSLGCAPTIALTANPSASAGSGSTLTTTNVIGNQHGIFFHGTNGAVAAPFHGGFLCVGTPIKRHALLDSGGTVGSCDGVFGEDFNAYIASGVDPALVAGAQVWLQNWSRDPSDPFGDSLSGGVTATICP